MKNFRPKDKVVDKWYTEAGTGIVLKVLKTRIKVKFPRLEFIQCYCALKRYADENYVVTYDRAHYQFLYLVDQ